MKRFAALAAIIVLATTALAATVGAASAEAAGITVSTLAGMAGVPPTDIDGVGPAARFYQPTGAACDSHGNIYMAEPGGCTIRKITPAGVVTTLAGKFGIAGSADGTGTNATFNRPWRVACDTADNVYVADCWNHTIRKITPAGVVSTLAGTALSAGSADGAATVARFRYPAGIACDKDGNVYVGDTDNHTIRKITPAGVVSTLAGVALSAGSADGTGAAARFYRPQGLACDTADNVYVADSTNNTIRKITPAGVVSTLAGTALSAGSADGTGAAARFWTPSGVACDAAGTVYVAEIENHTIRAITPAGVDSTLAGVALSAGSADGSGAAARFYSPQGVACDTAGNRYVADTGNCTIRKITGSPDTTSPTTAVSGVPAGWVNHAVKLTFTGSDNSGGSSVDYTQYSTNGGTSWTKGITVTISTPGSTTVSYRSADKAGNVEVAKTCTVMIDTGLPQTTAKAATVKANKVVSLKFTVADPAPTCGQATVTIKIKKGAKTVKTLKVGLKATNTALTYKYKAKLKKGRYSYSVWATDVAGNKATSIGSATLKVK